MLCTVVRWQLSNELDRGSQRGWLARSHLARCDACRQYSVRLQHVDGMLAAGARVAKPPSRTPITRHVGRNVQALVVAAAMAIALVVVVLPASTPPPAALQVTTHVESTAPAVPEASGGFSRYDLVHAATSWLDSDPLQDELVALKSDTLRGATAAFRIAGFHHRF